MAEKIRVAPFWGCMIPVKYPQMELSVRKTMAPLGVELVDLDGFSCCPDPIYFKARDKVQWLTIAARNLCIAEQAGLDVITMCSGCTSTLQEARFLLAEDENLKALVNQKLKKIGKEYKGTARVKHIVVMMRDDLGIERVKSSVVRPLTGVKVGIHYGCHLLKPSQIMHIDDADYPSLLETLVRAIGATPLTHTEKLLCCGKGCMDEDMPLQMTHEIFHSMESVGADVMGLICPTCFNSFDMGQILIARKMNREFNMPVIYFCQLLGLAQGFDPEEVGLHLHRIKIDQVMETIAASETVEIVVR
ncbi:MAG TPA: CoB--CoM heterodisulfide reductase subunit B [bacterium]|nr:CoB--CoM heterodisulfide reductase subunit B [bacterium]